MLSILDLEEQIKYYDSLIKTSSISFDLENRINNFFSTRNLNITIVTERNVQLVSNILFKYNNTSVIYTISSSSFLIPGSSSDKIALNNIEKEFGELFNSEINESLKTEYKKKNYELIIDNLYSILSLNVHLILLDLNGISILDKPINVNRNVLQINGKVVSRINCASMLFGVEKNYLNNSYYLELTKNLRREQSINSFLE